jgi:hypothetical protein
MTLVSSSIATFVAAGVAAAAGMLGGATSAPPESGTPTALVIDAAEGRDGRELVDERLRAVQAEVRLPRTPDEARTNLRYFQAQRFRLVVAGPETRAAVEAAGVDAVQAADLLGALTAARR